MKTIPLRKIQRNEGKAIATEIAAGNPVRVDTRAYIVPKSWLDIQTVEKPVSCKDLGSLVMQERISADKPIPLRFGISAEIKAWLISLAWWETLNRPEAPSD